MKKFLVILLTIAVVATCVAVFASCTNKTYEIAVVTDVGQLNDGGFNQGTWEGAEAYAKAHNLTYKYYQPANGSEATDNDRVAAMRQESRTALKLSLPPVSYKQALSKPSLRNPPTLNSFSLTDGQWVLKT